MNRIFAIPLLLVFCLATAISAQESKSSDISGVYLADEKDHKIELYLVGNELRGRIVWTAEKNALDKNNKDPSLRSRLVVGIEHLRGLKHDEGTTWDGGILYNPEDGKFYDAKLWLDGTRLVIRGKPRIAVLGRLLGALFGRITYTRVGEIANPTSATTTGATVP